MKNYGDIKIILATSIAAHDLANKKGATIFGVDRHLVCWLLFLYHLSFKYIQGTQKGHHPLRVRPTLRVSKKGIE